MRTLFPERLTRLQFLLRSIVASFLTIPIELHFRLLREGAWPLWDVGGIILLLIIAVYTLVFIIVPRGADIGFSKILSGLVAIVPLLNVAFWLLLLFTKTDAFRRQ